MLYAQHSTHKAPIIIYRGREIIQQIYAFLIDYLIYVLPINYNPIRLAFHSAIVSFFHFFRYVLMQSKKKIEKTKLIILNWFFFSPHKKINHFCCTASSRTYFNRMNVAEKNVEINQHYFLRTHTLFIPNNWPIRNIQENKITEKHHILWWTLHTPANEKGDPCEHCLLHLTEYS